MCAGSSTPAPTREILGLQTTFYHCPKCGSFLIDALRYESSEPAHSGRTIYFGANLVSYCTGCKYEREIWDTCYGHKPMRKINGEPEPEACTADGRVFIVKGKEYHCYCDECWFWHISRHYRQAS